MKRPKCCVTVTAVAVLVGLLILAPGQSLAAAPRSDGSDASDTSEPMVDPAWVVNEQLNVAVRDIRRLAGTSYTNAVIDVERASIVVYLTGDDHEAQVRVSAKHPSVTFAVAKQNAKGVEGLTNRVLEGINGARVEDSVVIREVIPQSDGTVEVVTNSGAKDQLLVSRRFGDLVTVASREPARRASATRGDDTSPWNGGDFIYYNYNNGAVVGGNCSSGTPLHSASGVTYMLTAAHCFAENNTGIGTPMRNGYAEDLCCVVHGSGAAIGTVSNIDRETNFRNTDTALIRVATSNFNFNGSSTSPTKATQSSAVDLADGSVVCSSGAYSGRVCNIIIRHHFVNLCDNQGNCTTNLKDAWRNDLTSAAGEGDSGGPVYALNANGTVAPTGMIDAISNYVPCNYSPPGTALRVCGYRLLFENITAIDNLWALTPNT